MSSRDGGLHDRTIPTVSLTNRMRRLGYAVQRMVRDGEGPRVTMLVRNPFTHDTRVEREVRTLSEAGYRVTVVAEDGPGLPARDERAGARVVRVRRVGPPVPGLRFFAHAWRLARAVRRTRPDLLHAHDADALQVVGPIGRRRGIPVIYDSHELWLGRSARGRSPLYHRLARAYYGWVERRYVPAAAAILVANPPVAVELERRYGVSEVIAVPNYPSEADAVVPRDLRDLPGGAGIPPGAPIVLYVGAMTPERGIEELVDAMVGVPDGHLVLLGGGGLEPVIRARVAERGIGARSHFLGMVASDEVVPFAASARVGILSTMPTNLNNRLALPNKLFQYMAAGIPVVASDYPQIRDVVEGSACGLLVDPTDSAALAAAIRVYAADGDRAARDGASGRRAVTERYHWGLAARALLDAYARAEAAA